MSIRRSPSLLKALVLVTALISGPAALRAAEGEALPLVPWPVKVVRLPGEFEFKQKTSLILPQKNDSWITTANIFADKVGERFGVGLCIQGMEGPRESPVILVHASLKVPGAAKGILSGDIPAAEGYKLKIRSGALDIWAESGPGFHNSLMTLLQLIEEHPDGLSVPALDLIDYPRFSWRGILFDPARTFLPPEVIKRYIDLLSEFKLNVVHLHLTDDQGFRMESQAFPRLHQVGGTLESLEPLQKRALDRHGWGRHNRGYYTREEVREMVAHARDRKVMVVPEIDVPGHSSAMLAAYPELSCSGEPAPIRSGRGIWPTALCPGKEEVYEFLDELFKEVAGLFPGPYIHIGGDEVLAGDWLDFPGNQELMARHGYRGRSGLQGYFMGRVDEILKKHGKTMIGWDEITGYLPEGAVLQAWRRHDPARTAAENGHDAIVSLFTPSYLNYSQLFHTMKGIYFLDPVPKDLSLELSRHILGSEVCLWGHQVTLQNIDRKIFPRAIAHAERTWSGSGTGDWEDFLQRLKAVEKDMEERGASFGKTWRDPLGLF